jgi:hypothetical protein
MATDDERREVAERLRALPDLATMGELAECVFGRKCSWSAGGLADTIADLVEPSDRNGELCVHCEYCDYCDLPKCSDQDGYSFKPKGYVDLLVLEDRIARTARQDMEICGDTVPAWYAAARLEAVARSIREILGVES